MQIEHFKPLGGVYSETAAVCNVLAHLGLQDPHTGEALNEAALFGISGGVGFSYFTFAYQGYAPPLYLGMANHYKTPYGEYMDPLFERLGIQARVQTTSSIRRAQATLLEGISQGKPVVLHVDRGRLHGLWPVCVSLCARCSDSAAGCRERDAPGDRGVVGAAGGIAGVSYLCPEEQMEGKLLGTLSGAQR